MYFARGVLISWLSIWIETRSVLARVCRSNEIQQQQLVLNSRPAVKSWSWRCFYKAALSRRVWSQLTAPDRQWQLMLRLCTTENTSASNVTTATAQILSLILCNTSTRWKVDVNGVKNVSVCTSAYVQLREWGKKFLLRWEQLQTWQHCGRLLSWTSWESIKRGDSAANSCGCEVIKCMWTMWTNVDREVLFAWVLCILLFLLFFGLFSLWSHLNYCLHCPHDFLWCLKVLVRFFCNCKLPVNVQKYRYNKCKARTEGSVRIHT